MMRTSDPVTNYPLPTLPTSKKCRQNKDFCHVAWPEAAALHFACVLTYSHVLLGRPRCPHDKPRQRRRPVTHRNEKHLSPESRAWLQKLPERRKASEAAAKAEREQLDPIRKKLDHLNAV